MVNMLDFAYLNLLNGELCEWARQTKSCAVIGYPSGQDGAILSAQYYHNFWQFTRTADYPHRSFFAKMRKKIQQITCIGR